MSYDHLTSSVEGLLEPIAGEASSPSFEPVPVARNLRLYIGLFGANWRSTVLASRGCGDVQELCQRCAPIDLDEIFSQTKIYGDGIKLLKLGQMTQDKLSSTCCLYRPFASVYFTWKQNRIGRSFPPPKLCVRLCSGICGPRH